MPSFSVTGFAPEVVDTCGGDRVTVSGCFQPGVAYTVTAVATGTASPPLTNAMRHHAKDANGYPLAYSGAMGQGAYCYSSDGSTISFAAPRVAPGAVDVTITETDTGENAFFVGAYSALPPFVSSMTFTLRSSLPLNYATGPRSIDALPLPDDSRPVTI
jgi:hypothetical protein